MSSSDSDGNDEAPAISFSQVPDYGIMGFPLKRSYKPNVRDLKMFKKLRPHFEPLYLDNGPPSIVNYQLPTRSQYLELKRVYGEMDEDDFEGDYDSQESEYTEE